MKNNVEAVPARLSMEKIIDIVRSVRNNLIKDFLVDENLRTYFIERYNKELSAVRMEFLKRDLNELLLAPVDLSHYSLLIKEIKENNSASLANESPMLFYTELENIFRKYYY